MRRTQLKLAGALIALVVLTCLSFGYLAERQLGQQRFEELARSLEQRAQLVLAQVGDLPFDPASRAALDELAERAAREAAARVTLIAADGRVVADSDVAQRALNRLVNHADRPEVRAARERGTGISRRHSESVGRELLYFAVVAPGGERVVRLAVPAHELSSGVGELRRAVWLAGGLGSLLAVALSFLIYGVIRTPLDRIRSTLVAVGAGDFSARVRWRADDEMGGLARAVDEMGEQLEGRLAKIAADREQLQAVLGGMVDGVLVLDARGRIALVNSGLRELFELPSQVEGRMPLEAIRNAEIDDVLRQALQADVPVLREVQIESPQRRVLRIHAVSFSTSEGERGVVAVFHDLTDVRRLETMRRDFVANASHEIRTPLTAIRGFTETVLSSELPRADADRYLRIVLDHSGRLARLVDDLLELSRIESGALNLELTAIDLGSIARDVLRQQETRFREGRIETGVHDDGAPLAQGDPHAVQQVLQNLLDNALKYTEPGGRVDVHVTSANGSVVVEVADSGIGIGAADQARIFERFYRVDKARSRERGGTGLGLAIVKHLVHEMGGEISVGSTPGVGSTFRFSLPRHGDDTGRSA